MKKLKKHIEAKIPTFSAALILMVGAAIASHFIPKYSHGLMFAAGMLVHDFTPWIAKKIKRK